MNEEKLNIDDHIKRLWLIVKQKYRTQKEQAKALGITTRTLINYNHKYGFYERKTS